MILDLELSDVKPLFTETRNAERTGHI
jgi:hypothetical protein